MVAAQISYLGDCTAVATLMSVYSNFIICESIVNTVVVPTIIISMIGYFSENSQSHFTTHNATILTNGLANYQ